MTTSGGSLRARLAGVLVLALPLPAQGGDDCNRNGVEDALDIATGTSWDCNRNLVPDECDLGPTHLAFEPPLRFRLGEPAQGFLDGIVLGDFNGDARPDVVTGLETVGGARLSILLNAGDGRLGDPVTFHRLSSINGLAAADLNGDGKLDLALGEIQNGSVIHTLPGKGDGTFGTRRTTSFGGNAGRIAAADLDGDRDIDLLVSPEGVDGITLFKNTGLGAFQVKALQPSGRFMEMFLVAGDLDGDRDIDFLTPPGPGEPGLILSRNRGDATFDSKLERDDVIVSLQPFLGDFDGDGDLDLLASGGSLLPNLGDGAFDPPRATDLATNQWFSASSGVAADIDRDGDLDLALQPFSVAPFQNRQAILLARNCGDGTFPPPEAVPAGEFAGPLAVADMNGDGVPDIVARGSPSGSLLVLLGRGTLAPASPDVDGNQVPDECEPDCDRDGLPDAYAVAIGMARDCNQNGFPDSCDVQARVSFEPGECVAAGGGGFGAVAPADLDGDGDLDLAYLRSLGNDANPDPNVFETDTRLEVFLNSGDGTFAEGPMLDFNSPPHSLAAGDLDGDGLPDLFGTQWYRGLVLVLQNRGNGIFALVRESPAGQYPNKVHALDLNGDGRVDLLVECGVNETLTATVLINQGGRTFSGPRTINTPGRVVALQDLDQSGAPDLITDGPVGSITVTWNDGSGAFRGSRKLARGRLLAAADLDGDRDVDLAVDDPVAGRWLLLRNRGGGDFDPGADLPRDLEAGGFIVFDADGDRDADLVGRTLGSKLAVLPGDGRGGFGPLLVSEEAMPPGFEQLAADFTGDGLADLAVLGTGGCLISTLINRTPPAESRDADGNGVPDECAAPSGGQLPVDGNQDGILDVSDAIWVLGRLFLGAASPWPCEGGWGADPGPADIRLLDAGGDGALDLSDPIALLRHLFIPASPPPALGTRCVKLPGCPDRCAP